MTAARGIRLERQRDRHPESDAAHLEDERLQRVQIRPSRIARPPDRGAGARLLLVPSCTDTEAGAMRVRVGNDAAHQLRSPITSIRASPLCPASALMVSIRRSTSPAMPWKRCRRKRGTYPPFR